MPSPEPHQNSSVRTAWVAWLSFQRRFEALQKISPPEYQLLNNIKLFTTSLVFRVVALLPPSKKSCLRVLCFLFVCQR